MLDVTRRFLAEVPLLADMLEEALKENPVPGNNPEELREHLVQHQKRIVASFKEEKRLYRIQNLPAEVFPCPDCAAEVKGAYWELSNPATGRRALFPSLLLHGFIEHGATVLVEPIINLSNILMGEREVKFDLRALVQVLAGAELPEGLREECEAFAQNPAAFDGAKIAMK